MLPLKVCVCSWRVGWGKCCLSRCVCVAGGWAGGIAASQGGCVCIWLSMCVCVVKET